MGDRPTSTRESRFAQMVREFAELLNDLEVGELSPTERVALHRLRQELVQAMGHTPIRRRLLGRRK